MSPRPVHQPPLPLHPAIQAIKEDGLSCNEKNLISGRAVDSLYISNAFLSGPQFAHQ